MFMVNPIEQARAVAEFGQLPAHNQMKWRRLAQAIGRPAWFEFQVDKALDAGDLERFIRLDLAVRDPGLDEYRLRFELEPRPVRDCKVQRLRDRDPRFAPLSTEYLEVQDLEVLESRLLRRPRPTQRKQPQRSPGYRPRSRSGGYRPALPMLLAVAAAARSAYEAAITVGPS